MNGQPVWWNEDCSTFIYHQKPAGWQKGSISASSNYTWHLASIDVLKQAEEGCNVAFASTTNRPDEADQWTQYVGKENIVINRVELPTIDENMVITSNRVDLPTIIYQSVQITKSIPAKTAGPFFPDVVVELRDPHMLATFNELLRESVVHHTSFHGTSACDSFKARLKVTRVLQVENLPLWWKYLDAKRHIKAVQEMRRDKNLVCTILESMARWNGSEVCDRRTASIQDWQFFDVSP